MTSGAITFSHVSLVMKCSEVDGWTLRFWWMDHAWRCVHQLAGEPTT